MTTIWFLLIMYNAPYAVDMESREACVVAMHKLWSRAHSVCISRRTGEVVVPK